MDCEDFGALVGGMQGEDSILDLAEAHRCCLLTEEQRDEAWHYVASHIENRQDAGLDVPAAMREAAAYLHQEGPVREPGEKACPRCAGKGSSKAWRTTGYDCFRCSGKGFCFSPARVAAIVLKSARKNLVELEARGRARRAVKDSDDGFWTDACEEGLQALRAAYREVRGIVRALESLPKGHGYEALHSAGGARYGSRNI